MPSRPPLWGPAYISLPLQPETLASNIWIAAIKSLHSFIEAMLRTAVRFRARRTVVDKTRIAPS